MKFYVFVCWLADGERGIPTKCSGFKSALRLAIADLSMGYGDGIETEIVIKRIPVVEWIVVSNEAKRAES